MRGRTNIIKKETEIIETPVEVVNGNLTLYFRGGNSTNGYTYTSLAGGSTTVSTNTPYTIGYLLVPEDYIVACATATLNDSTLIHVKLDTEYFRTGVESSASHATVGGIKYLVTSVSVFNFIKSGTLSYSNVAYSYFRRES